MMKKLLLPAMIIALFASSVYSQTKTELATEVKAKYQQNIQQLMQYTWQREIQVFEKGDLKSTTVSAVTLGPNGKPVANLIDKTLEKGVTESQILLTKAYIDSALNLVSEYIFMNQDQMEDLFNKGTVSIINDNYQVQAFNFFVQGDYLNFIYKINTLYGVSQKVNTLMNGDTIRAEMDFQTLEDLNYVSEITLNLPEKGIQVVSNNSKFAKKIE